MPSCATRNRAGWDGHSWHSGHHGCPIAARAFPRAAAEPALNSTRLGKSLYSCGTVVSVWGPACVVPKRKRRGHRMLPGGTHGVLSVIHLQGFQVIREPPPVTSPYGRRRQKVDAKSCSSPRLRFPSANTTTLLATSSRSCSESEFVGQTHGSDVPALLAILISGSAWGEDLAGGGRVRWVVIPTSSVSTATPVVAPPKQCWWARPLRPDRDCTKV